jgi:hypothetical protein
MVAFTTALLLAFTASQQQLRTPTTLHAGIHINEDGKCIFGTKSYWDSMYQGTGDRPAESYSWYCGWEELAPFWKMLVPSTTAHVLVAGIGNDPTPVQLYDHGWTNLTAFDYSNAAVRRATQLFGPTRHVNLFTADARDLPLADASVDAILDKGTLDAIAIAGALDAAVHELTRVTAVGGVVVCISRVISPEELWEVFDASLWERIHDGSLAFAPDGEATIDLGAELYSWRRRASTEL